MCHPMAMAKLPPDAGIDHESHNDKFGAGSATPDQPYPKIPGMNKPKSGHAGSHDHVAREHGRELKKK